LEEVHIPVKNPFSSNDGRGFIYSY